MSWGAHQALHKHTGSNGGYQVHIDHPDLVERTIGNPLYKHKAITNSISTRQTTKFRLLRSQTSKKMFNTKRRINQSNNCKNGWESGQFSKIDRKLSHIRRFRTNAIKHCLNIFYLEGQVDQDLYIKYKSGNQIPTITKVIELFGSFDSLIRQMELKLIWKILGISL